MNIFEAYEKRMRRRGVKPATIKNYHLAVNDYLTFLGDREIDPLEVDEETLEDWSRGNKYAPTTREVFFWQIASVYKYAHKKGSITVYPFVDALPPKVPEKVPQILSNALLREIRSRCLSERQETIWALYVYTGLRMHEGQTLHSSQIKQTDAGLQLDIIGKGGKLRYVPVHQKLEPVLRDTKGWVFPSPRTGGPIGQAMLYKELADMWPDSPPGQAFHSFRRTVASSLDKNGVQEAIIEKILGWSRFSMFDKHYRNIADSRLHDAIGLVYADDPL